jgi:hypothetical protein
MGHTKIVDFYFEKESNRGPNTEWIVSSAFGCMSTNFLYQHSFVLNWCHTFILGGHGCVDMVVGFSTTYAISVYHH